MQSDLHPDDPKLIWQSQPVEASTVGLLFIREKARTLHARARRQRLGTLAVPLIVGFFYAFSIKQFPSLRGVSHSLFASALVWSMAGLYFLRPGNLSGALPADAGFRTGLEFCRQQLERQCDYFRGDLLWSFGPVLLAIAAFVLTLAIATGMEVLYRAMPLVTLALLWIAAYLFIRARRQSGLQRELAELREIEKHS